MIKINLATRKQSGVGGGESKAIKMAPTLTNINLDQFKELPLRKVLVPLALAGVGYFLLNSYKEDEIRKLDAALGQMNAQNSTIQSEIAKLKSYEPIRKSLEQDEITIRTKLDTIKKLMADRSTPPRLLMSVANSMPKEVWLNELRLEKGQFNFKGTAMDYNQISDFMKGLNDNAFFSDVNLKDSQQVSDAKTDMANFEVMAKRR